MTSKYFVFLLVIIPFGLLAQESRIDSLLKNLDDREVFDKKYVDLVNELSFEYLKSDPQKAPYYTNLAISVAKEIGYTAGLIRATTNKGSSYWVIGLQDEALSYYLLSLSYNSEDFPLEYVRLNNNIGEVFKKKSLFDSAQKYYRDALQMIDKKLPNQNSAILLSNIAEAFLLQREIDSAEYYYQKCLDNSLKENSQRGLAYAYFGLGEVSFYQFDINKAEELQKQSLEIRKKINDTRGIIQSLNQLGMYEIHKGNASLAFDYWDKAEELSISFRALDLLNEIYRSKSEYYYQMKQYKKAAEYIGSYTTLSDSIKSEEFASSLERTKTALLSEVSDAENKLLKQQQEQAKKEGRLFLLYGITFSIVIISILVVFWFYRKRKANQKEIIVEGKINNSLLSLSKEVNLRQSNYDDFITDFLYSTREVLKTDRASYWYLDSKSKSLVCYRLVDSGKVKELSNAIPENSPSVFFKELVSKRTFAVSDVRNDPRCAGVNFEDLLKGNITAFLAAPLYLNDKFVGLIGYSMVDYKREWSLSDQRYVGSLADILVSALANNQRNSLETEKEDLIEKLIRKNKSLKEFNSVISHNLREPLAQVIGFSNLLSQNFNLTSTESNEIVSRLSHSSARIDTVIKDLSTILNEQDPESKDFKEVSLTKVINEVIEVLNNEIKRVNPDIKRNLTIPRIRTYKPFLFDIIYHLISNALKFRRTEELLTIDISSSEDEENFYLEFSDNGRGIDLKSFKDRIFKMYMRHHHDVEGRGVGLYIVKNRVESLNGKVDVVSKVMKGSTFKITLPKKGIN